MVTGSRIWHMTHSTGLLRFVWVMTFFGDMMKSNNLYPFLQPIVEFRTLSRRIGWFSGMVRRHMWLFLNKMKGFYHLKRHIYLDKTGYHWDHYFEEPTKTSLERTHQLSALPTLPHTIPSFAARCMSLGLPIFGSVELYRTMAGRNCPLVIQKLPTGVFQVDGLHPKWLFLHQKLPYWFQNFFA